MKRVTKTAWFVPKRAVGWKPARWQGVAVLVAAVVLDVCGFLVFGRSVVAYVIVVLTLVLLWIICVLTGDPRTD